MKQIGVLGAMSWESSVVYYQHINQFILGPCSNTIYEVFSATKTLQQQGRKRYQFIK